MSAINPAICIQCRRSLQNPVPPPVTYLIQCAADRADFVQFAIGSNYGPDVIAAAQEDTAYDWNRLVDALAEASPDAPMEDIQDQAAALVAASPASGSD